MKNYYILFISMFLLVCGCVSLKNANSEQLAAELEKDDPELLRERGTQIEEDSLKANWPPPINYLEGSLGMELQKKFKAHADFCGFIFGDSNKNFVPADIKTFLSKKELESNAESANIEGASILFYMFSTDEKNKSFNKERYLDAKILTIEDFPQFKLSQNPNPNFDSYLMTKTCGGFVNASVEAGIKPPYTSFEMAVKNDSKKESAMVVVSGKFVSPLTELFENHQLKTYALLKLWEKYKRYPDLIGKSHYLSEFDGVMIKRTANTEDFKSLESSGKLDYSGTFSSKIQTDLGMGINTSSIFKATDWETIILTNFNEDYKRVELFRDFPNIDQITEYFNSLRPIYETSPIMVENGLHDIVVSMENIPLKMSNNSYWSLEKWPEDIYDNKPELIVDNQNENSKLRTKFILRGTAKNQFFNRSNNTTELPAQFKIVSRDLIQEKQLEINVDTKVLFSKDPVPQLPNYANYEPYRLNPEFDKFGIKWSFEVGFSDDKNPVDFSKSADLENVVVKNSVGNEIQVKYDVVPLKSKSKFLITIYDPTPYNLQELSTSEQTNYNFSGNLAIPLRRANIKKTISLPFSYPVKSGIEKKETE